MTAIRSYTKPAVVCEVWVQLVQGSKSFLLTQASCCRVSRSDPCGTDRRSKRGWGIWYVPSLDYDFYLLTITAHKPTEGTEATDITAFHPDQRDWEGKGVGRPDVLKSFAKPQGFTNPEYNLGFMYFDGLLVIDHEGQPLQPFRGIPLTLSSKLEGWRAEAIRRSDPRIRHMDLLVRMPVKVEPAANGILTRQALVKINAVVGRQNRFREQAGAISWGRPTARKARDFLWSLLPQHCRDNNLALPRDLTKQERWQLLALTVGTNPAKARTVENADKGMTREQYIDGVHRRAAQLPVARGSNARRQWKNAVRNATRQAAPESPSNAPTSPRDELELAQDVTDFLQVRHSASPALDEHHQPASAALALSALGALPAIPALPALPALAVPAVPSRSPEQVCGPLILGPVNPPFPVVRPGGYLCDEYTKFF